MTGISDYVIVESMKNVIVKSMKDSGLHEQVEEMTEEDMYKMLSAMHKLGNAIAEYETEEAKNNFLLNYIIQLWALLIIDHKHF